MSQRIDPVCGMEVAEQGAPTAQHNGKKFFFCSGDCRDEFESDPEEYGG